MVSMERNMEVKTASHVHAASIPPPPQAFTCPVCETEGHSAKDCAQLPMLKDTMWVNQRQGQWQKRSI